MPELLRRLSTFLVKLLEIGSLTGWEVADSFKPGFFAAIEVATTVVKSTTFDLGKGRYDDDAGKILDAAVHFDQ